MASEEEIDLVSLAKNAADRLGVKGTDLKKQQIDAITAVLGGKDTFVNLPTGFGKSLIYQCLPLCFSSANVACTSSARHDSVPVEERIGLGVIVVISPLTSLIDEQVSFLRERGVPAINLAADAHVDSGLVQGVVFTSPECLLGSGMSLITDPRVHQRLMAICVDESHCVVKWGQNSRTFSAFRECYGRIAEIRSLVPKQVPLLALTATASMESRQAIISSLGMCAPNVITESPEKVNIRYSHVKTDFREDNPDIFQCFVSELQELTLDTPRTIVFCRTHRQVRNFYSYFREVLSTDLMSHVAMFHSTTVESRKASILKSFHSSEGVIRLLFCTIAFGMGVNVKGVTRVVHFGPPESVDDYVQESGRAGRDGEQSYAILVTYRGCTRHKVSAEMKEYFQDGGQCKRELLLKPFGSEVMGPDVRHKCCEPCAKSCKCSEDGLHCSDGHKGASPIESHLGATQARSAHPAKQVVRDVQQEQMDQLQTELIAYHSSLSPLPTEGAHLLCGDVAIGFPAVVIDWILRDVRYISSADYLHENYPFFSCKYSDSVWDLLCRIAGPPQPPVVPGEVSESHLSSDSSNGSGSESSVEEVTDRHRYRCVVRYSSSDSN